MGVVTYIASIHIGCGLQVGVVSLLYDGHHIIPFIQGVQTTV